MRQVDETVSIERMMTKHLKEMQKDTHDSRNCIVCQAHYGEVDSSNTASGMSREEFDKRRESMEAKTQDNKYELPEEQQTEEAKKAEQEENLPAIMQEAFELEDEMRDIEARTNPDGTVVGYVKEISMTKKGGTIAVDVDLPAEPDLKRFHFQKPKAWTREYRWVRFVEEYVGGSQKIANFLDMTDMDESVELSGENGQDVSVMVKQKEDDYEILIPNSAQDYLYKISRQRYGVTKQDHVIWRLLPVGVGLWSAMTFSLPIVGSLGLLGSILNFIVLGGAGMLTAGFLLLVFGALFLNWGQ